MSKNHSVCDRRSFLCLTVEAAGGVLLPGCVTTDVRTGYEVVLLGDLHYSQVKGSRYFEMWRTRMPSLLSAAARDVRTNTRFVLQVGDLVDGDMDRTAHVRMMTDAWNLIKATFPDCPVSQVVGNHDVRGKDGIAAYREFFLPRLSTELGRRFDATTYAYPVGDDAFLHLDFNDPDGSLPILERLLDETKSARRLFFVTHGPVIPNYYDGPSYRWIPFGDAAHGDERRWLLEKLAKRHAVVLAGHIHKTDFLTWRSSAGSITQITVSSVWDCPALDRPTVRYCNPDEYARPLLSGTDAAAKAFFSDYAPGIVRYRHLAAAGRFVLKVSERCVSVEFRGGDSSQVGFYYASDPV